MLICRWKSMKTILLKLVTRRLLQARKHPLRADHQSPPSTPRSNESPHSLKKRDTQMARTGATLHIRAHGGFSFPPRKAPHPLGRSLRSRGNYMEVQSHVIDGNIFGHGARGSDSGRFSSSLGRNLFA